MSKCTQNFKRILVSKALKNPFSEIFTEGFVKTRTNFENPDNIWTQKVNELVALIVSESSKSLEVNSYDFDSLKASLSNLIDTTLTKTGFNNLDYVDFVEDLHNFEKVLPQVLKEALISGSALDTNPSFNDEKLFDFSKLSKLLYESDSYENYLKSLINTGLFKTIFINNLAERSEKFNYEGFVVTDAQLNKNLATYKNELWDYIYNYYSKHAINPISFTNNNLYKISEIPGSLDSSISLNEEFFNIAEGQKSPYMMILEFIKDRMDLAKKSNTTSELEIYDGNAYTVAQAYIKSIVLSNFDSFLLEKHSDKVNLNLDGASTFNLPTNGSPKYALNFKWNKKSKIDNSGISDIEESSTSLAKMMSYVIPYYEEGDNGKWRPNKYGLTIGKSNLDSVGAIINELNITHEFQIEINGVVYNKNIGELFLLYDNGDISFKNILEVLIEQGTQKDNSVLGRKNVLKSIHQFLYGRQGLSDSIYAWRDQNKNMSDFITNPEQALINHIRTTVKNSYNQFNTTKKSKFLDLLDLDSSTVYDFSLLVQNLSHAWKYNKISNKNITNFEDFMNLLTNKDLGGLDISERTKKAFLEIHQEFKNPSYYKDQNTFGKAIKFLLGISEYPRVNRIEEAKLNGELVNVEKQDTMTQDEIVDYLMSNDVANNNLFLIDLFKLSKRESKYNIQTQTKDSNGAAQPVMGVSNLASLFSIAVNKTDNFFLRNKGFYKRTSLLMEVVGTKGSKSYAKLNAKENFKTNFIKGFIEAKINSNEFTIQPFNYSDKVSNYGITVNTLANLSGTLENKSLTSMTSEQIKEVMFTAQNKYYIDLLNGILLDLSYIDPSINLNGDIKSRITQFENILEKINVEAKEKGVKPKVLLNQKINEAFQKNKDIEITEDLHYSIYDGELKVNQLLKSYIQIFSNKELFDKWTENREQAFIRESAVHSISLDDINYASTFISKKNKASKIKDNFGDVVTITKKGDNVQYSLDLVKNDKLTEIAKKFLWSKNLVVSQYMNTTVKDTFLHPAKKGFVAIDFSNLTEAFKTLEIEEDKRATTFTKRMNVPGASIAIYGKNKEGILLSTKFAIFTDPTAAVFNPNGESKNQDVYDGGAFSNPFFNELLKSSLPGYALQSSQKPLGESITSKTSTTLKFATFALSNEEIRLSNLANKPHYNLMKKMNSINLWEDGGYVDLFKVPNQNGGFSELNISEMFPNYHIIDNGVYKEVQTIRLIKDNEYVMIFDDGTTKQFKVNTLFDLWEAVGGEYSSELVDPDNKKNKEYKYNEASIDLVASIIKKHSLFGSTLELRDKMIGMTIPQSAVKKGATNINNYSDIYKEDYNLTYFNFDTSFLGVQLDPFHSTEGGHTNEITQVMSAIAEMASTPELYNLVYDAISNVVEKGLAKFKAKINNPEAMEKIIEKFIYRMNNSSQINNARAIVNGLSEDIEKLIPLDNKTTYKQFISFLISETNAEFIRRQFPGSSSVLRPSYGFMQIFEDVKGTKYLATDLIKMFDSKRFLDPTFGAELDFSTLSGRETFLVKSKHILNTLPEFQSVNIQAQTIRPLDTITLSSDLVVSGKTYPANEPIHLKSYDDYFKIKKLIKEAQLNDSTITISKVYNIARDLKPVDITFELNGIENSIWDTESFNFKWELDNDPNIETSQKYIDFVEYIKSIDKLANIEKDPFVLKKIAVAYASRWISRTFNTLSNYKLLKTYDTLKAEFPEENPFKVMFRYTQDGEIKNDDFRFRYEGTYINTEVVANYIHRNPENIHTNVNVNNFKMGDKGIRDVSKNTFKLKINPDEKAGVPFDLILHNTLSKERKYILIEGVNYGEVDGNLYTLQDIKEGKLSGRIKAHKINPLIDPDGEYRIDTFGKKLYKLPENYSIYADNKGNEFLMVNSGEHTALENLTTLLESYEDYDYIQTKDKGFDTVDRALTTKENDKYYSFLKSIRNGVNNGELERFFDKKLKNYLDFKNTIKPKELNAAIDKSLIIKQFDEFNKTIQNKTQSDFLDKLAKIKYFSFQKSLEAVVARIPAQAMQSFMGMDTVGFISGNANDIYVSHWQLFLQGSDYDIDKVYMMMYSMSNGLFDTWSPIFDIENFKQSVKIPLPNGKSYRFLSKDKMEINTIQDDVETTQKIDLLDPQVFNLDIEIAVNKLEAKDFVKKATHLLRKLNAGNYKYIYSDNNIGLAKHIIKHQKYFSEKGFKNFIVNKLLAISSHANNQVSSSTPISFGVYELIKKSLESANKSKLSTYDGYTMGKQQEQNSIGKDVIGVAATGLKDYFALVKYYNDYFTSGNLSKESNQYFEKTYVINGKRYQLNKISGLNNAKKVAEQHREILKSSISTSLNSANNILNLTDEQISNVSDIISELKHDEDASLIISAILSLATDNAKELMLAKINAGLDFAGMHIYLTILGVDAIDATKFMTSENAFNIKNSLESDIYSDQGISTNILKKLSSINNEHIEDIEKKVKSKLKNILKDKDAEYVPTTNSLTSSIGLTDDDVYRNAALLIKQISDSGETPTEKSIKIDKIKKSLFNLELEEDEIYNFYQIFADGQELISLGSYLKVNQGSKATQEELFKLLNNLRFAIINQEKGFISKMSTMADTSSVEFIDNLRASVSMDKPYLSEEYVNNAISGAMQYGIINSDLDLDKFFNEPNYQKAVIDYYNIIKSTFNTLDVLKSVPHFNSMYKSFVTVEGALESTTNKYYMIRNFSPVIDQIVKDYEVEGLHFDILKHLKINGKVDNPSSFDADILNSVNDYYDNHVIFEFFKTNGQTINLPSLMDYLNIRSIKLLDNDTQEIKESEYTKQELIDAKMENVNLKTQYGLALFRYLMEEYIIPNEKSKHPKNGFLSNFVKTSHLNYNLRNQMSYYLDESNYSELQKLELGISEIANKENDTNGSFNLPIIMNADSVLQNMKFMDMLTIYNLLVNEGRFGGNRTTNLFYRDLDNIESISRKFINFEKNMTKQHVDELVSHLAKPENSDLRDVFLLKVFGVTDIMSKDKPTRVDIDTKKNKSLVINRYFNFLDSNIMTTYSYKTNEDMGKDIMDEIKSKNIRIDKENCK